MTTQPEISAAGTGIRAEWSEVRLLYPLYCALGRECAIEAPACHEAEKETDHPTQESLEVVHQWFTKMDERIEVYQLRHFLQTTTTDAGDEALRALLQHHLRKRERNDSDRNKTDFLLVQFVSLCAPSHLADSELDLACVARILEPVLGAIDLTTPDWLQPLDELAQKAEGCKTLKELFTARIIEQGRKMKESCGESYFTPIAMAAFTRSGFLLRRVFFRLMHQDLNAILDGLRELEARGIESLDCRKAQFSAYEPLLRLRMICQSWKVMFHAEYSSGQPLCLLVDLRTVVDTALAKTASGPQSEQPPSASERSRAAVAGADGATELPERERPEFEVFAPSSEQASENSSDTLVSAQDNDKINRG
jgi:hypothetical protein